MESVIEQCRGLAKANASSFQRFSDFPLSSKTLHGLEDCEYEEPTDIQRESLPFSLRGLDVVGAAKTGSGKTLALIIPVLESLWRSGWSNYCGLGALIIAPTRELALQTFTVINHVGKYHDFSCALLIGGTDVDYERNRIGRVNIIICTPGRLLQHMDENEQLLCEQLQILVLDEADRILDMGFSQQVNAIVANLPKERQTLLFSATQTRNVKDLSRVCTKDPVFVSAHERCAHVTPDCLVQSYMVCEDHDKVNTIWSFIVNNKKSKTIVFVSSCKQARFLTGAFCHLRPGLPVMGLWGTMNQKKRIDVFQKFENKEDPVFVSAHERCAHVTPDCLVQSYMVCEDHDKVNTIWSFIVNNKKSKTIVFVSSCKQARFLTGAFCHLRPGLPVMGLWGTMNQKKRIDVFQKFENKEAAVMIATDVASRGLDFSDVDWVVQVDCPASVEDYIHRVGRTARMNQTGHAVLFLTSSQERPMVAALAQANIPVTKQIADPRALVDIRTKMQATLSQFPELNQFAQKSVVAYLRSIYMMRNKKVFDVTTVDAAALAASYGLVTVPRVRFLSKKGISVKGTKDKEGVCEKEKKSATSKSSKSNAEEEQRTTMGSFDFDDENDDIFVVKKKDVFSLLDENAESTDAQQQPTIRNSKNVKVVTKMSAAKKLLNKKLKVNVRKLFDEEGEPMKVDGVVDKGESVGLDLDSAKESIKQSSVEDRKRHKALLKQKKKEEKERLKRKRSRDKGEDVDLGEGGSGIDSDADLSFLPDPDEVRKRYAEQASEEDVVDNSVESPAPLRKRRKQRKEIVSAEEQALALLNPF
ncbi:DEAD/DEAH box helicase [Cooperia oncophora]